MSAMTYEGAWLDLYVRWKIFSDALTRGIEKVTHRL